jgi:hypothetical protein
MPNAFDYDPTIISSITCKTWNSFSYGLDALSPWCLVYISVDRFISIAFPSKRFIFKRKNTQIIYMIMLILFNIIYHINIPFSIDLLVIDNTTYCSFINNDWQLIDSFMDLVNCALIPFVLMLCFSILLIRAIFKSRSRVNLGNSVRESKRLKKDIKFAISSLLMNLLFLILVLPLEIDVFLDYYNHYDLYNILYYIYYISYAVNFYVLLLTNSLFRKVIFHYSKKEM